jgi:DnaJ-class molecular chaperone
MKDYYQILQVGRGSTYHQIKKSYRLLAKQFHPDKNSDPEAQAHFSEIAEAYNVLSDLKKRQAYDLSFSSEDTKSTGSGFYRRHYSGYPYFQYDIFTPFIHRFFVGDLPPNQNNQPSWRLILMNYRIIMISIFGALLFFKFFSGFDGMVLEKKIEAGLFNDIDYFLILKTNGKQEKKKRVSKSIYEQVEVKDLVFKERFSLNYSVNEQEKSIAGFLKVLLQAGVFYALISVFLFFLEYSRT